MPADLNAMISEDAHPSSWSIRSRIRIALSILSGCFLLLVTCSFWNASEYRALTRSVGRRALEMPRLEKVVRQARSLRSTRDRIDNLDPNGGRFDAESRFRLRLRQDEINRFEQLLTQFDFSLKQYEDALATNAADDPLIDVVSQQRGLDDIRGLLTQIESRNIHLFSETDPIEIGYIRWDLDELVSRTTALSTTTQKRMTSFSANVRQRYHTSYAILTITTLTAVCIIVTLTLFLHLGIYAPFNRLVRQCRLITLEQKYDDRIPLPAAPELRQLAGAMNEVTTLFQGEIKNRNERVKRLDDLVRQRTREAIQNEKLSSMGFLAAGLAHEINNPTYGVILAAGHIQSTLQSALVSAATNDHVLIDRDDTQQLVGFAQRIEKEIGRCSEITSRMLSLGRMSQIDPQPTDLGELIVDTIELVTVLGKFRCRNIHTELQDDCIAMIESTEIRQVLLNLIVNALESVLQCGNVTVRMHRQSEFLCVQVEDDGCGMDQEVLDHLFEPFFTQGKDGKGTGLGLSITHRIVTQHGGQMRARSDGPGKGALVEFTVPVASSVSASNQHSIIPVSDSSRRPKKEHDDAIQKQFGESAQTRQQRSNAA